MSQEAEELKTETDQDRGMVNPTPIAAKEKRSHSRQPSRVKNHSKSSATIASPKVILNLNRDLSIMSNRSPVPKLKVRKSSAQRSSQKSIPSKKQVFTHLQDVHPISETLNDKRVDDSYQEPARKVKRVISASSKRSLSTQRPKKLHRSPFDIDTIVERTIDRNDYKNLPKLPPLNASIKAKIVSDMAWRRSHRVPSAKRTPSAKRITRNFTKDPSGMSRIVSIDDNKKLAASLSNGGGKKSVASLPDLDTSSTIVPFANGTLSKRRVHADGLKMLEYHYELIED